MTRRIPGEVAIGFGEFEPGSSGSLAQMLRLVNTKVEPGHDRLLLDIRIGNKVPDYAFTPTLGELPAFVPFHRTSEPQARKHPATCKHVSGRCQTATESKYMHGKDSVSGKMPLNVRKQRMHVLVGMKVPHSVQGKQYNIEGCIEGEPAHVALKQREAGIGDSRSFRLLARNSEHGLTYIDAGNFVPVAGER